MLAEHRDDEPDPASLRSSSNGANPENPVKEYALPSKMRMKDFLNDYFGNPHKLNPYIDEELVRQEFGILETGNFQGVRKTYLALINMLFAMALQTSAQNEVPQTQRLQLSNTFFQRALKLRSLDFLTSHTTESVQVLLLMTQYLGTCRSMVCWNMLGVAVRAAQALGLHKKTSSDGYEFRCREYRNRLWYATVTIDM